MAFKRFGHRATAPATADNSAPVKRIPKKRRVKKLTVDSGRPGRLTAAEKNIITAVIADTPGDITPAQQTALAVTLRRQPDTIADAVVAAREKLQQNLGKYVDLHLAAAEQALASDDTDVARKAAEFAIEKVSARRSDGKVERLIDAPSAEASGPRIQIGIALGGIGQGRTIDAN